MVLKKDSEGNLYSVNSDSRMKKQQQYFDIIDADFEAFTKDEKGNNIQHKPFLVCGVSTKFDYEFIQGEGDIYKFLCDINSKYNVKYKTFLVRFYNLSYDRNFIFNGKFEIQNLVENGTKTVCFELKCGTNTFKFQDNLLMFNTKLKDLPNMFFNEEEKKMIHKEYFPYTYYTEGRYQK